MTLTPWIKPTATICAHTTTSKVLVYTKHMLALPTQYCASISLRLWPDGRSVRLLSVVACNASVEFVAAEVLNGDYVQSAVVVCALCKRGQGEAVDCRWLLRRFRHCGEDGMYLRWEKCSEGVGMVGLRAPGPISGSGWTFAKEGRLIMTGEFLRFGLTKLSSLKEQLRDLDSRPGSQPSNAGL